MVKRYAGRFTAALQNAWATAEKEALDEECNGTYLTGEVCGYGNYIFLCAQDYDNHNVYTTKVVSRNVHLVSYHWFNYDESIATYRMIRNHGRWLVDGVHCSSRVRFNMD